MKSIVNAHLLMAVVVGLALMGCDSVEPEPVSTDEQDAPAEVESPYVCRYENPFSNFAECKEYLGNWEEVDVEADCGEIFTGIAGTVSRERCDAQSAVGTCTVDASDDSSSVTYYYGGDLGVTSTMCTGFLNGVWEGDGASQPDAPNADSDQALNAMVSNDDVTVVPECTNDTCVSELAGAGEGIWFRPARDQPTTGLIFYPGGGVDPRAYAPAAQMLASNGLTVVIVPMPGNIALGAYARANEMMASEPSIQTWFLAGHSAGGGAAIKYVAEHPDRLAGLLLLAAYGDPADNLRDSALPTLSLYGTVYLICTLDEIETSKATLPADTLYIPLQGGNHAQFGYYGPQTGDGDAYITHAHQHDLVTNAMMHFISSVVATTQPQGHPGFQAAGEVGHQWCSSAQKLVAGLLDESLITVTVPRDLTAYGESKPSVEDDNSIYVRAFAKQTSTATELRAPSVFLGEIWCKMKTQQALPAGVETGAPTTCMEVNQAALHWALEQLSDEERSRYNELTPPLTFGEDALYETGLEWLQESNVTLDGSTLTASRLTVAQDRTDLPEPYRGVHYCKVWSPARALLWALTSQ